MTARLEVAAGSIDITPTRACALSGFASRKGPFTRICDPLELNVCLLRQGGTSVALVSADLLYVGERIEPLVRAELERAGLTDCAVIVAASHTHFAPSVVSTQPALGACDETFVERYLARAQELVRSLLAGPWKSARIRHGTAMGQHSINRRRVAWQLRPLPRRAVAMLPNPEGANDQTMHVLRFESGDGEPLAFCWSYACHPTAFPSRTEVSSEFPGVVRSALRLRHGALPVLYLQGFAGNLRAPSIARGSDLVSRVSRAITGPSFGAFTVAEYRAWASSLARLVVECAESAGMRPLACELSHGHRELPLSRLVAGYAGDHRLEMRMLALSRDVRLVALSAEVVIEFAIQLRRLFRDAHIIPVGCVGSVQVYLPTARMLTEGGYEAGGFFEAFGVSGRFRPSLESDIMDALIELATPN